MRMRLRFANWVWRLILGFQNPLVTEREPIVFVEHEQQPIVNDEAERNISPALDYSVTGAPRHIPWSRRKKELEQDARQNRRKLEQFREDA